MCLFDRIPPAPQNVIVDKIRITWKVEKVEDEEYYYDHWTGRNHQSIRSIRHIITLLNLKTNEIKTITVCFHIEVGSLVYQDITVCGNGAEKECWRTEKRFL